MTRFYVLLGAVALIGGAALFFASRDAGGGGAAAVLTAGAMVEPAADGFTGFTLGSDTARMEVVEYSDFECPWCARFAAVQMPAVKDQLIRTGRVRWRYRDFPLPSHRWSRLSAHAAHCGGEQGRFWEMHDQLFFNHQWAQVDRDPTGLFRDFARAAGLELAAYDACMASGRHAGRIEASKQEGERRGVNGTPTFFVNGRRFTGQPTSDAFKRLADSVAAARR